MATDTPAHGRSASLTAARHHVQTPPTRDRETLLRALYEQYEQQLQQQLAGFEPTMIEHSQPTLGPPTPPPDLYLQSVLLSPTSSFSDPQLSPDSRHAVSSPFASHIRTQSFSQPLSSLARRVTTGAKPRAQTPLQPTQTSQTPRTPRTPQTPHSPQTHHRRSYSLPASEQPQVPLRFEGNADPMPSIASPRLLAGASGSRGPGPLPASAVPSVVVVPPVSQSSTRAYWCTCCGNKYARKTDWARHDEACRDRRSYMRHAPSLPEVKPEAKPQASRHGHSQSYSYIPPAGRPNRHERSHTRCESYGWNDSRVRQESRREPVRASQAQAQTSQGPSQSSSQSSRGLRRRPPQRAWACGFCAAFLGSRERYQDHVALHFEGGKTLAHWHYANVIYGLLHQPAVHAAWKCIWTSRTAALPAHLRTKVSWPPETSEKLLSPTSTAPPRPTLQDALEHFDPLRQSATLLASRADALAIFVTVPVDDEGEGEGEGEREGPAEGQSLPDSASASPAMPSSKTVPGLGLSSSKTVPGLGQPSKTVPGLGLPMSTKPSGRGLARKSLPHFPQSRPSPSASKRPPPLVLSHARSDSTSADSTSSVAASSTASSSSLGFGYTTGLHHHRRAATSPTNFARPRPVRLLYPAENQSAVIPGLRLRPRPSQIAVGAVPSESSEPSESSSHTSPCHEGRFPSTTGDDADMLSPEFARILA